MKKTIFVALLLCALVGFTSCNNCSGKDEKEPVDTVKVAELVLENTVSLDREIMYAQYSKDFCWYESEIVMKDCLDEDCDGTIESITNVFQTLDENSDPTVYLFKHTTDTTTIETHEGYWCEDILLDNKDINLTFTDAFEKVMSADMIKPHSKCCTLRDPLGPKIVNPQYIFGNVKAQIYVDAVTGKMTDKDPAFEGFEKPVQ